MPENEMEQVLRGVAWECQRAVSNDAIYRAANKMCKEPFISLHIERVLRESGLLRLLEAGQAMRAWKMSGTGSIYAQLMPLRTEWDAALAEVRKQCQQESTKDR